MLLRAHRYQCRRFGIYQSDHDMSCAAAPSTTHSCGDARKCCSRTSTTGAVGHMLHRGFKRVLNRGFKRAVSSHVQRTQCRAHPTEQSALMCKHTMLLHTSLQLHGR